MTEIITPPKDLDLQVKMLYEMYGWDILRIAEHLSVPETVVQLSVSSQKLSPQTWDIGLSTSHYSPDILNGDTNGPHVDTTVQPYNDNANSTNQLTSAPQSPPIPPMALIMEEQKLQLKATEIGKQQHLAPLLASIELSLITRIQELAMQSQTPDTLASLVTSFKRLTQDSIINIVAKEEKSQSGSPTAQTVVQVMQFNDK